MEALGQLSFREYDLPDAIVRSALHFELIQSNVCGSELHRNLLSTTAIDAS